MLFHRHGERFVAEWKPRAHIVESPWNSKAVPGMRPILRKSAAYSP
jgi:hypothetical protein